MIRWAIRQKNRGILDIEINKLHRNPFRRLFRETCKSMVTNLTWGLATQQKLHWAAAVRSALPSPASFQTVSARPGSPVHLMPSVSTNGLLPCRTEEALRSQNTLAFRLQITDLCAWCPPTDSWGPALPPPTGAAPCAGPPSLSPPSLSAVSFPSGD